MKINMKQKLALTLLTSLSILSSAHASNSFIPDAYFCVLSEKDMAGTLYIDQLEDNDDDRLIHIANGGIQFATIAPNESSLKMNKRKIVKLQNLPFEYSKVTLNQCDQDEQCSLALKQVPMPDQVQKIRLFDYISPKISAFIYVFTDTANQDTLVYSLNPSKANNQPRLCK